MTPSDAISLRVAAAADWRGVLPGPLHITLRLDRPGPDPAGSGVTVAAGVTIESITRITPGSAADVRPFVAVPAFVNAHTHLDLSALGPRPYDPALGFAAWLDMVRRERPADDDAIARAVRLGVALSRAGGVAAVGDIAGSVGGRPRPAAWRALVEARMPGVSHLEFFAIGRSTTPGLGAIDRALDQARAIDAIAAGADQPRPFGTALGLQPHAPYSVGPAGYARAVELAAALGERARLSTHLAETLDERRLISRGDGPVRDFLDRIGVWDPSAAAEVGRGLSPIAHAGPALRAWPGRWTVAHANDADDADIEVLARAAAGVVYCPRAWDYFGHGASLPPHPWRRMAEAGVTVALGTDSIINLDTKGRISPIDDAYAVWATPRGPRPDPITLLRMITVHPAALVGVDPAMFTLEPRRPLAGLALLPTGAGPGRTAQDPLAAALTNAGAPEVVALAAAHAGAT